MINIWVDDIREAPEGWTWCRSVNETIQTIKTIEHSIEECIKYGRYFALLGQKNCSTAVWTVAANSSIGIIDLDHDAGDYASDGGDFIKILDWMEATNRNYRIRLHTMNPVGRMNMETIIRKNNWEEVK